MSVEITTLTHTSPFGPTMTTLFFRHVQPAERLLVLLPGRGYTVNHPVLFHLLYLALENGWDALPVSYGFQMSGGDFRPEQFPLLQEDVALATAPALASGYRRLCVAGKSMGTSLAVDLARSAKADSVSLILLTPVGGVMQALDGIPTLAVIGTNDPLYSPDVVRLTESDAHVDWRVYDGLNHSLIVEGDWRASLAALREIMDVCEWFLGKHG
ncbi:MAG: alpha/beta hydrolase [Aggregatilineales bacterium]